MGGLYNLVHGYNPAVMFALPMLGHCEDFFPRFRDAFFNEDKATGTREIAIFTRVGSLNQNSGYGEEKLYQEPNYLRFEDWNEDETYGTYFFQCPQKWEKDYDALMQNRFNELSEEFISTIEEFWTQIGKPLAESLRAMKKEDHQNKEEN